MPTMTDPRISVITREQWAARPPNPSRLSIRRDNIVGATFHHTTGANLGSESTEQWARNIQNFCMDDRTPRYGDIEYNAMVRAWHDPQHGPRGVFVEGRDPRFVGAHASSTGNVANRTTVGVALMGNGDDVLADAELRPLVVELVQLAWYFVVLTLHAERITSKPLHYGHRDWIPHGGTATYCPSNAFEALVASTLR
jgi:hypothetical protein